MAKWAFGRIRDRVLFLFLIIVFIFTLAVMITTGFLTRSLVDDLVEQNAWTLVQSQSMISALWQEERMQELKQLANSALLESLDWVRMEPHLQRQIKESAPYFLIYLVATPDGNYNTTLQRQAGNIGDREYFSRVMAGETVISEPMISKSTGEKTIVVATPIWNSDRSAVIGLLGLSIDLVEMFYSSNAPSDESNGNQIYLVNSQGYFISHHDVDQIMSGRMQDLYPDWDSLQSQATGSFTLQQNGAWHQAFFQRLPGPTNWSMILQVPVTFFTKPVQRLIVYLFLVSFVAFLLVLWLGTWFASTISKPIVELNQIFKQGAQGDLTVRAEVAHTDELGETRASFNLMMDTIGTMTYYDPLTGLPNRQHFFDHLISSLKEDETVILALISIRGLSEFKTLLGPEVTDGLLVRLADTLKTVSHEKLVIARIADAEFGMIIPSGTSGVLKVIDSLDNLLAHPLRFDADNLNARLFGGISISENRDLRAEEFYQQAQAALYEAEHSSQEQLKLYNPNTHHAIVDRLRFQTEIRNALDKKQFTVFYQPIIDLETNSVVGKEALIRWKHPIRGLLIPSSFLEAAEQGGFIEELGQFMLEEVCDQHRKWQNEGRELGWVAVNISANHFRSPHFPSLVQSVLRASDAPAHRLRIEVTEDAMLAPTPEVLQNFHELRKLGVHMAIDDFGTAYSSLEYLIRYPMETLKIDRAFINQIDVDGRTRGLVRSIIGIGKNLSMIVVAEGVERQEQLKLLEEMGCTEAQGYLFSRPVPWEDYPQLIVELDKRLQQS